MYESFSQISKMIKFFTSALTICRQSSEPMEPPPPVTSTVFPFAKHSSSCLEKVTLVRPNRSSTLMSLIDDVKFPSFCIKSRRRAGFLTALDRLADFLNLAAPLDIQRRNGENSLSDRRVGQQCRYVIHGAANENIVDALADLQLVVVEETHTTYGLRGFLDISFRSDIASIAGADYCNAVFSGILLPPLRSRADG